ncbi:MAG: 3-deoxy-D-manno-octulosonate 8-phosphate phosphatase [Gemmatimonadetes bacterium]|nr:3-deoxy-D-manno-octulosonate 8-phosphate phosphatase [Gemmatimonadota bacterium]
MSPSKTSSRAALREIVPHIRLLVFDFDGVFTDNTVVVTEDGGEAVRCWRGDGLGLTALRACGMEFLIISTETNKVVSARAQKLGLECLQGVADKGAALAVVMQQRGLSSAQVAYVGNDVNDLACLRTVGLPIIVQDAHPAVRTAAKWRTRAPGGRGAVREVCDTFAEILTNHARL